DAVIVGVFAARFAHIVVAAAYNTIPQIVRASIVTALSRCFARGDSRAKGVTSKPYAAEVSRHGSSLKGKVHRLSPRMLQGAALIAQWFRGVHLYSPSLMPRRAYDVTCRDSGRDFWRVSFV